MFWNFKNQIFFDDDGGGGGSVTNLPEVPSPSSEDIDALAGDDDDGEEEPADEAPSEGDEEGFVEDEEEVEAKGKKEPDVIDEEKDEKVAAKPEKDEDEPTVDPADLASIKALKNDYPDIFKKHPALRVAIAEHRQFRGMFSSLDEAKETAQAADNLFELREKIIDQGDFGFFLDEINKTDGHAAARLVKKVLPAILERSRDLYYEVTEEPIQQFVHAAYSRALRENNTNLKHSAMYLWKFLGKDGNPAPAQPSGQNEVDRQFESRVQEFEQRKFTDASSIVNREIVTGLEGLIEHSIDPGKTLKETTKKALVKELVREIDREVASDPNHMSRVERLWKNAKRSSYAQGHTSRIISAYLERAKQLLPKHARKVREELNISPGNGGEVKKPATFQKRENAPAVRASSNGNAPKPRTIRDTNPRSIDWQRTSDEDILSGKARLRR